MKQITEEALGRALSSCVEVKIVGGCEHEMAKLNCPASCGLCDDFEAQDRLMHGRQMAGKCIGG